MKMLRLPAFIFMFVTAGIFLSGCDFLEMDPLKRNINEYGKATLEPGVGIKEVKVYESTREQIEKLFGPGTVAVNDESRYVMFYGNGLSFNFGSPDPQAKLNSIEAIEDSDTQLHFKGKTSAGVKLDDTTRDRIREAHGKPVFSSAEVDRYPGIIFTYQHYKFLKSILIVAN